MVRGQIEQEKPEYRGIGLFLLWLLLLSLPFYLLGCALPGSSLVFRLPASALMFVVPSVAAMLSSHTEQSSRFAWKSFVPAGKKSYILLAIVSVAPATILLSGQSFIVSGQFGLAEYPRMFLMLIVFLLPAALEEIGWSGFLTRNLNRIFGGLFAALLVGTIWAFWHIIPYYQSGHTSCWVAWQCGFTVLIRVPIATVFLMNQRGILHAICIHAATNAAAFALPGLGVSYDPYWACCLTLPFAVLAVTILLRSSNADRDRPKPARGS